MGKAVRLIGPLIHPVPLLIGIFACTGAMAQTPAREPSPKKTAPVEETPAAPKEAPAATRPTAPMAKAAETSSANEADAKAAARFLSVTGKRKISIKVEKALNAGLGGVPKGFDRSSPKRSWSAFRSACLQRRWEEAAHIFNLGDVPIKDQRALGVSAARKFCAVLKTLGQLSAEGFDDTTVGPMLGDTPTNYLVAARVVNSAGEVEEAWLRNTQDAKSGQHHWVLTRRSLSNVGAWYRQVVRKQQGREAVAVINQGLGPIPPGLKLHSPRATAETFIRLVKEGAYDQLAHLMDLNGYPKGQQKTKGKKLARRLSLVLSRLKPGFLGALSNDPRGAPEQGVPDDQEQVLAVTIDNQVLPVRLGRYPIKGSTPIWIFTQPTVARVDTLYKHHGSGWAGDYLPPIFFSVQFGELQLWQWIGLLFGVVLSYIFGYILAFLSRKALLRAAKLTRWAWDDELVTATRGPMRLIFAAVGFVIVIGLLALRSGAQDTAFGAVKLVLILAVGWFLARALDVAGDAGLEFFRERDDEVGMAMVPVARRIFKPILWVLIVIVALQNVGINVAGLIAGLGIGGLALAMASKTTVENMLGGITIAFDRPFKVGDFIKVGSIVGSVEEVGLRSTRVRTLDRTVVTVPNGQMADSKVENYAPRDRIRLLFKIGLQYDSTLDQLRYIIDESKRAVLSHPDLMHDGFRVRFVGFADSALEVEIYTFVMTTDYNRFTAVREDLYLQVAEIVAQSGAEFAFPTRTIYNGDASSADDDKAKKASEVIVRRTAAGELTIPEIPDELRLQLTSAHLEK